DRRWGRLRRHRDPYEDPHSAGIPVARQVGQQGTTAYAIDLHEKRVRIDQLAHPGGPDERSLLRVRSWHRRRERCADDQCDQHRECLPEPPCDPGSAALRPPDPPVAAYRTHIHGHCRLSCTAVVTRAATPFGNHSKLPLTTLRVSMFSRNTLA